MTCSIALAFEPVIVSVNDESAGPISAVVGRVADASTDTSPRKWTVGAPRLSESVTDSVPPLGGNALAEYWPKWNSKKPVEHPPGGNDHADPTVTAADTPPTPNAETTVASNVALRLSRANFLRTSTGTNLLVGP